MASEQTRLALDALSRLPARFVVVLGIVLVDVVVEVVSVTGTVVVVDAWVVVVVVSAVVVVIVDWVEMAVELWPLTNRAIETLKKMARITLFIFWLFLSVIN